MPKTCNGCGTDDIATVTMSEGAWERHEERNKKLTNKLIAVILVLVVLLVGSNVAWLVYESQFETVEATYQEVVQEADNGENNFVGGDIIGTTDSENSNG
jgi:major membrane immunogen (membrane-anchored lipoprotein)